MVRNVLGSLIALAGATAAVWSPFRPWYDGRHGSDIRIEDLLNGLTGSGATLFGSLVLPMAVAGLLTLAGVALRSRLLVTVAGLVVLGFTVLWMVRQAQRSGELTAGAHGLGVGVANALGGGALLVLGALVMRGRTRRVLAHEDEYDEYREFGDAYEDAYTRYEPPPAPWGPAHRPTEEWHPGPYGPPPRAPDPTRPDHPVPPLSPPQRPTPPVEWGRELRQRDTLPAHEHEEDDRPTLPNRPAAPDRPTSPDHPTLPDLPTLPDRPNWPDEREAADGAETPNETPNRPEKPDGPQGPNRPDGPDDHRPTGPDRG
ncbi:hypothetical protein [Streptomyces sp. S186]|uniref:phage holin family protein n=1 Tax=Streptomyces sp. S186 TaxID=3434395 RepID=UPI003F671CB1